MSQSDSPSTQDLLALSQEAATENTPTPPIHERNDGGSQPIVNELLCFVTNKINVMPFSLLLKLCCDFYEETAIDFAKDILFDAVDTSQNPSKRQRKIKRRGSNKKHHDAEDIINMLLEIPPHSVPTFVAKDLSQLPPVGIHNFDICSLLQKIDDLNTKFAMMEDIQRNTIDLISKKVTKHFGDAANLTPNECSDSAPDDNTEEESSNGSHQGASRPLDADTENNDCSQEVNATAVHEESPQEEDHTAAVQEAAAEDDDLLRLASIQGRLTTSKNSHESSSFADAVRSGQPKTQRPIKTDRVAHNTSRSRLISNTSKRGTEIITGHGRNFQLRATRAQPSTHSNISSQKKRQAIGIFVSRLARNTRPQDVARHVLRETGLTIRCEPLRTKHDSYRSFFILLAQRGQDSLLRPSVWPAGAIIRRYSDFV